MATVTDEDLLALIDVNSRVFAVESATNGERFVPRDSPQSLCESVQDTIDQGESDLADAEAALADEQAATAQLKIDVLALLATVPDPESVTLSADLTAWIAGDLADAIALLS